MGVKWVGLVLQCPVKIDFKTMYFAALYLALLHTVNIIISWVHLVTLRRDGWITGGVSAASWLLRMTI